MNPPYDIFLGLGWGNITVFSTVVYRGDMWGTCGQGPKIPQTKVFEKSENFDVLGGGDGLKTTIFSVFAGKLTFWLPAP